MVRICEETTINNGHTDFGNIDQSKQLEDTDSVNFDVSKFFKSDYDKFNAMLDEEVDPVTKFLDRHDKKKTWSTHN